jgi:hypothetical protein
MLYSKFDLATASQLGNPSSSMDLAEAPSRRVGRLLAGLMLLALPLLLLWLLFTTVWNNVRAVGRGGKVFFNAFAAEYNRAC